MSARRGLATLSTFVAYALLPFSAGCGNSPPLKSAQGSAPASKPVSAAVKASSAAEAKVQGANDVSGVLKGERVLQKEVSDSGTGLQVKSIALLRSSLLSCTGDVNTNVSCDMHIAAGGGAPAGCATANRLSGPAGRSTFLLASRYPAGSDVIDVEAPNLYDPRRASRSGTGADELTDSYLRALGVIADVVAHNCDPEGKCDCSTQDKAAKLVERCFPGYDPASSRMKQTAMILAQACSSPNLALRRKAFASMIGSYAFAASR